MDLSVRFIHSHFVRFFHVSVRSGTRGAKHLVYIYALLGSAHINRV